MELALRNKIASIANFSVSDVSFALLGHAREVAVGKYLERGMRKQETNGGEIDLHSTKNLKSPTKSSNKMVAAESVSIATYVLSSHAKRHAYMQCSRTNAPA